MKDVLSHASLPAYDSLTEEEKLAFVRSHIFDLDAEAYQAYADKPLGTVGFFCQKTRFLTYSLCFYEEHGIDDNGPYEITASIRLPQKPCSCFVLKNGQLVGQEGDPTVGGSDTAADIHAGRVPFPMFKNMVTKAIAHASWMPQVYKEWQEHPSYAGMNDAEAIAFLEVKLSGIPEAAYEAFCHSPLDEETTLAVLPWGMCQLKIAKQKWQHHPVPVCMASLMTDVGEKQVSLLDVPILATTVDNNIAWGHWNELFRFMQAGRICRKAFLYLTAKCIRQYEGFVPSLLSFGWTPNPKQETASDGRDSREA